MTMLLNSLIAIIPFILLFVHSERTDGFFNPTERSVTDRYRGFFALAVILHHMAQRVSDGGLLYMYYDAGYLAVAAFFFYSGYGLMKKGIAQKDGFFRKKLPALLIPYVLAMIIYWILYAMTQDVKTIGSLLMEHFNNASGISFLWYVFAYLTWILFLGSALRLMKEDRQILYSACLYAAGYIAFCVAVIPAFYWIYNTILLIPLGCAWAYYEENISSRIQKKYRTVLAVTLVLFIISLIAHIPAAIRVPAYMVSAVLFMILLNTISMKFRPQSKALSFLGNISYELYILHGIPVTFLRDMIPNEALWTLSVLVNAVISAYLMNQAGRLLWKKPAKPVN